MIACLREICNEKAQKEHVPRKLSLIRDALRDLDASLAALLTSASGPPLPSEAQSLVVRKVIGKQARRSNKVSNTAESVNGLNGSFGYKKHNQK
jgi:hypothetical protein